MVTCGEEIYKDLEQFAKYILDSLKNKYQSYFSSKNKQKMEDLLQRENLHSFFPEELLNLPSINQEFIEEKQIKSKILKKILGNFVLINSAGNLLSIEKDYAERLRCGFVLFLIRELSLSCYLEQTNETSANLGFVMYLQQKYDSCFANLKHLIFSCDYMQFSGEFYELTGEDLLDVFMDYFNISMNNNKENNVNPEEIGEHIR